MFCTAKGEVAFTLVFQDDNKIHIREMYRGFLSNTMDNLLVTNIILPSDEEKVNGMACSKLNQLASTSD